MALPEANERVSHGEPTWFAGKGKVFASLDDHHHGAAHLSVWLPMPMGAQETLVARDPARYFRPPYVGGSGWVGVVLDGEPDWDEVQRLVREAYLEVAEPRLAALASAPPPRRPTPARAAPPKRAARVAAPRVPRETRPKPRKAALRRPARSAARRAGR